MQSTCLKALPLKQGITDLGLIERTVPSSLGLCGGCSPRNDHLKKQRSDPTRNEYCGTNFICSVFPFPPYREFFGQGWMKADKYERTPNIMKATRHFNHVSTHAHLSDFRPGFSLVKAHRGRSGGQAGSQRCCQGRLASLQSQFLHLLNR